MITLELLKRYNIPVPRYTSYPTVPSWKEKISLFRKQLELSSPQKNLLQTSRNAEALIIHFQLKLHPVPAMTSPGKTLLKPTHEHV